MQGIWLQGEGFRQGKRFSKKKMGRPDLLILFTNTVSHKMVISAFQEAKRNNVPVARVHSSSACALHAVLSARCTCCGAAEGVL